MNFLIVNQHSLNYGDDIAGISLIESIFDKFDDQTNINIIYNTKGSLEYNNTNVNHRTDITLKEIGISGIIKIIIYGIFHIKLPFNTQTKDFVDIVKESDVILVSPCGANIGIYKDWRFLIRLYLIVLLGKKPIFHNNTIGKSSSFLFNRISNYVLKRSSIYVRERKSYNFLEKININSIRSVDTGFLFKNDSLFTEIKDFVTFIPTELSNWHPDFKTDRIEDVVVKRVLKPLYEYASKNNYDIIILPHLYGAQDEVKLLEFYRQEILSFGEFNGNIIIPKIKDCYEYDNYIKHSNFVVSMRYHGVVMSIKNNVPFISLAYENKMTEVCTYSDLEDLNILIKDLLDREIEINILDFLTIFKKNYRTERLLELENICSSCLNQIKFLSEK